jgi:hypothetical protein
LLPQIGSALAGGKATLAGLRGSHAQLAQQPANGAPYSVKRFGTVSNFGKVDGLEFDGRHAFGNAVNNIQFVAVGSSNNHGITGNTVLGNMTNRIVDCGTGFNKLVTNNLT